MTTILVVHPDLAERIVISIQLESEGLSPVAVASAQRALERLATTPVDLVLADQPTLGALRDGLGATPTLALGTPSVRLPMHAEVLANAIRVTLANAHHRRVA
ncbi:MAG TPA: hypothetical protein VGF23_18850 [Gaiellaceae bacterium]|jgi:CheY-like chemotaxis protein